MDLRLVVGSNVRFWRNRLGISQEELAFRADVHRTYISGVERGVRNPTVLILWRIAKALQIEPAALLAQNKKPRRRLQTS